jgi:hypothetical protein
MVKRILMVAAVALICYAVAFSHEKGALAINVEVPIGMGAFNIKTKEAAALNNTPESSYSFDGGLRVTANYYFFPWLSVNAGVGFGGIVDMYTLGNYDELTGAFYTAANTAFYAGAGIPFGFRLNA